MLLPPRADCAPSPDQQQGNNHPDTNQRYPGKFLARFLVVDDHASVALLDDFLALLGHVAAGTGMRFCGVVFFFISWNQIAGDIGLIFGMNASVIACSVWIGWILLRSAGSSRDGGLLHLTPSSRNKKVWLRRWSE